MGKTDKTALTGCGLLGLFALWTALIQWADVQPIGPEGSSVGFAALNGGFHQLTGVHMGLYTLTDWLGLVPVAIGLGFAMLGLKQLLRRRSLFRVDGDILILGGHYLAVIACYLAFEMWPVNFRPVLIGGVLEPSYPSSTTLLVLGVTPTLAEQSARRVQSRLLRRWAQGFAAAFAAVMVVGRLISGVHWLTDIVGSVLLSAGLLCLYRAAVLAAMKKKEGRPWN